MDLGAIGTQYLNSGHVPLSHNGKALSVSDDGTGFAELLKKAQSSQGKNSGQTTALESQLKPASHKSPPIDKNDKLYEACVELETFLIKNLIKSMRNTVQKSELIKTGMAGGIYEDMLYDEYAKDYAKNAGFGFAEMAYRELSGYGR